METLTGIGHSRQSCDGLRGGPLLPTAQRSGQKLGPPLEVPIKAALGDAEPRGQRFHRERPETGLRNELKRSFGPVGRRKRGLVESLRSGTFTHHSYHSPIL